MTLISQFSACGLVALPTIVPHKHPGNTLSAVSQ